MAGHMGAVKLKRAITAVMPGADVTRIKNVRINGRSSGCSGFAVNPYNGRVVYVTTDLIASHVSGTVMYRNARDVRDYRGGRNRYADDMTAGRAIADALGDMTREEW